jgi:UDP-N-acetylglucosamine enolpyruvyl transferase
MGAEASTVLTGRAPHLLRRRANRHTPGVYHLDRGYQAIEKKLALVGADIARMNIADED